MKKPRAMVLAAGLGTRLRPLTDLTPKAMLEFRGRPMIDYILEKLHQNGFSQVVINLHHLASQLRTYLEEHRPDGMELHFSDESGALLDTGGGIVKASELFDPSAPVLIHNVDILSNIDLGALHKEHLASGAMATLAVKERETTRNLLVDPSGRLKGWRDNRSGKQILLGEPANLKALAFSGIHILSREIFQHLPTDGAFSITTAYLELAKNHSIMTYDHSGDSWIDMAHPSNFPSLRS